MGSGSSARKKNYAPTKEPSAILKVAASEADQVLHAISGGKKGAQLEKRKKHAAQVAAEKHFAQCGASDLQKVCTIRQAFPLCSASGGHRSPALLPEKLLCASCRNLITKLDDEETDFFCCRSCWELDRVIGLCVACAGAAHGAVAARPVSAASRRSGEPRESLIPHAKSGSSLEPPRRSSQRSNRSLSSGSSEEDLVQNRTIFGRVHTDTSRSYLRKKYTKDRRQSDPGDGGGDDAALAPPAPRSRATSELPQLGPPRPASPPSRPSSRNGSKQRPSSRQQSKESLEVVVPPSGAWKATILEGSGKKQKTRTEERHLDFYGDGVVQGSASFDGRVDGLLQRPDVQWTECYGWGSIVVKLKFHRNEPWHLEGTFEASDGGHGKITLVHEELKAAEMGT